MSEILNQKEDAETEFFKLVLKAFSDNKFTAVEEAELKSIQEKFNLDGTTCKRIINHTKEVIYESFLRDAYADSNISYAERQQLDELRDNLGLSYVHAANLELPFTSTIEKNEEGDSIAFEDFKRLHQCHLLNPGTGLNWTTIDFTTTSYIELPNPSGPFTGPEEYYFEKNNNSDGSFNLSINKSLKDLQNKYGENWKEKSIENGEMIKFDNETELDNFICSELQILDIEELKATYLTSISVADSISVVLENLKFQNYRIPNISFGKDALADYLQYDPDFYIFRLKSPVNESKNAGIVVQKYSDNECYSPSISSIISYLNDNKNLTKRSGDLALRDVFPELIKTYEIGPLHIIDPDNEEDLERLLPFLQGPFPKNGLSYNKVKNTDEAKLLLKYAVSVKKGNCNIGFSENVNYPQLYINFDYNSDFIGFYSTDVSYIYHMAQYNAERVLENNLSDSLIISDIFPENEHFKEIEDSYFDKSYIVRLQKEGWKIVNDDESFSINNPRGKNILILDRLTSELKKENGEYEYVSDYDTEELAKNVFEKYVSYKYDKSYLFPENSISDISELQGYDLHYFGTYKAYIPEPKIVQIITGSESELKRFAAEHLQYELAPEMTVNASKLDLNDDFVEMPDLSSDINYTELFNKTYYQPSVDENNWQRIESLFDGINTVGNRTFRQVIETSFYSKNGINESDYQKESINNMIKPLLDYGKFNSQYGEAAQLIKNNISWRVASQIFYDKIDGLKNNNIITKLNEVSLKEAERIQKSLDNIQKYKELYNIPVNSYSNTPEVRENNINAKQFSAAGEASLQTDRAITSMARYFATNYRSILDENTVIIPAPQHTGNAEYTLEIAKLTSLFLTCPKEHKPVIMDVLKCAPHDTLYEQKKNKNLPELTFYFADGFDKSCLEGKKVLFLDNVISTGTTFNAANKLFDNSLIPMPYAITDYAEIKKDFDGHFYISDSHEVYRKQEISWEVIENDFGKAEVEAAKNLAIDIYNDNSESYTESQLKEETVYHLLDNYLNDHGLDLKAHEPASMDGFLSTDILSFLSATKENLSSSYVSGELPIESLQNNFDELFSENRLSEIIKKEEHKYISSMIEKNGSLNLSDEEAGKLCLKEMKEHLSDYNNNPWAALKATLNIWESQDKNDYRKKQVLNYLLEQGCTSKENTDSFFEQKLGCRNLTSSIQAVKEEPKIQKPTHTIHRNKPEPELGR